jgi:hypothetical protein
MRRRISLLLATVAAIAVAGLVPGAARAWAPADTADIHPGVQTVTGGGQCTSNFIFQDVSGVYLGQAAHCSGTGGATETNGCDSASLPLGATVEIEGASQPGVMVYNSWLAMQAAGESRPNACEYNDFALVRVDPADVAEVNPSVPGFRGPTGLAASPGGAGSAVYSYGNSSLRGGVSVLKPKQGTAVQNAGGGWSAAVYTATPGIPGDSGSGFLTSTGQAFGVLATLQIAPLGGSNGVGSLSRELAYAQSHGFGGLGLVRGTEPFDPNLAGAILTAR